VKTTFFKGVVLGAVVSVVTVMATAAFAGSGIGAVFNLGKGNIVNHQSALSGSTNDQELRILNSNTGDHAAGSALAWRKDVRRSSSAPRRRSST
jgi:hypothetical protein